MSGTCAVLEMISASNQIMLLPCRIQVDGKTRQSTATSQAHYFHIQRSPAVRNLDIIDVQPAERWHKERSLIEAPAVDGESGRRAFVRLRDNDPAASDFVVVLEAVSDGLSLRAQCYLMTASKDTPLKDIQHIFDNPRWPKPLDKSANNGAFTLQAVLKPEPRQRKFDLRLDKLSDSPAHTTNVTFELERRRRATEIECMTKVRQAVMEEDVAVTQAIEREQGVLHRVNSELSEVEQELLLILEKKKQLVSKREARLLVLNDLRETHDTKERKLTKLKLWVQTVEEQLKGVVDDYPPDAKQGEVRDRQEILHLAAAEGYEDLIQTFLEKGAPIEEQDAKGWRPLHIASRNGHANIVRMLLDKGADTGAKSNEGSTPLHMATYKGHEDIVRLLLEREAEMTAGQEGWFPLHIAAYYGFDSIAQLFLDNGSDVSCRNDTNRTPLHLAAKAGHITLVRLFLDRGADVESVGKSNEKPLHLVARNGHTAVARLILDSGASIDSAAMENLTPLHYAAFFGHDQVVSLLLERGASPARLNRYGMSALEMASQKGHENAARLLRESGAVLTTVAGNGSTPLYTPHDDDGVARDSGSVLEGGKESAGTRNADVQKDEETEGSEELQASKTIPTRSIPYGYDRDEKESVEESIGRSSPIRTSNVKTANGSRQKQGQHSKASRNGPLSFKEKVEKFAFGTKGPRKG